MSRQFFYTLAIGSLALAGSPAAAETMSGALWRAYDGNPDINQQRAAVRVRDEGVPQAKAGWLPKAQGGLNAGHQATQTSNAYGMGGGKQNPVANPRGSNISLTEIVFDGMRTADAVDQAEAGVRSQREILRQAETTTLLAAATAYMDVLRDSAVLSLRRNNIEVLKSQLKQTQDRFRMGEVTLTDTSQAEAALAGARADFSLTQANLATSVANFRRQVGVPPSQLQPAQPIEKLLPHSLDVAFATAMVEHPAILGALHQVDAATAAVKSAEAALMPTVSIQGQVQNATDSGGLPNYNTWNASVIGQISIPLYQGGAEYAAIRQAKEQLGQTRLGVDSQRIAVRAGIAQAWAQLQGARASILSYEAAIKAAETALKGVREEAKIGQRTTQDVLNAQQALLNSRIPLVTAQHDRVVNSYAVYASIGRLSVEGLGLGVSAYDPRQHYQLTKNRFFGWDTVDGR